MFVTVAQLKQNLIKTQSLLMQSELMIQRILNQYFFRMFISYRIHNVLNNLYSRVCLFL